MPNGAELFVDTALQLGIDTVMARAFAAGVPYCIDVKVRGVRSPFTEWQIAGKK
jgi:hypothetical protein